MGSTATFTTTVNNSFQAAATIAFTNAITYGPSPSTPIFAANTFYTCVTGGGGTGLNFTVGSNVIGVDGNLNVPTGTTVYSGSVTYQIQL